MKRWHWVVLVITFGVVVIAEVASWAVQPFAFRFYPSWLYIAILMHLLPWPQSAYAAVALGVMIDLYSPAPFGIWMLSLFLLVTVGQWVHTTWLKQATGISILFASLFGMMAASVPIWIWQVIAAKTAIVSQTILVVHWWQWPLGWIPMSLLAAVAVRILPSRYERFV
jgi:cell shape-determining protein MreD